MHGHDIIVVGTSAGGVESSRQLVRHLPPGLPASLFVVCHFPADLRSFLPDILSRSGPLLATHARDGEPIRPGHIYVAPPDYHLLIQEGRVQLSHGPRENRWRPAIDPLFRTAARVYGRRVVGVILSGTLSDGVAGLLAVRTAGGVAMVQDPEEALSPQMPRVALELAGADHVLPLAQIASTLTRLARQPADQEGDAVMPDPVDHMADVVNKDKADQVEGRKQGKISCFSCPECGGVLWQVDQKELTRFRCHVGHVYDGELLINEKQQTLEAALWTALRTFREKTVLGRQLAARERAQGNAATAERFEEDAQLAERYGDLIHQFLLNNRSPPPDLRAEPGLPGG